MLHRLRVKITIRGTDPRIRNRRRNWSSGHFVDRGVFGMRTDRNARDFSGVCRRGSKVAGP
jgi:hypothetical protein